MLYLMQANIKNSSYRKNPSDVLLLRSNPTCRTKQCKDKFNCREEPTQFLVSEFMQICISLFENSALANEQIMIYMKRCGTDEHFLRSMEGLKFSGLNHKSFSF